MKIDVEDGLLEKIVKIPEGGTLEITNAEADKILASRYLMIVHGGTEAIHGLMFDGRCVLLGRNLVIAA